MDEKSLNLWRQIDGCRRNARKRGMAGAVERPGGNRGAGPSAST